MEEVHAETTGIPPLDAMLIQQIILYLKGLIGLGVLHSVQEIQDPSNSPIAITFPKFGGNASNDAFFRPLLDFVLTCNEHEMLAMFFEAKTSCVF